MSGSQCQNDILMKIIASVCGVPVVIPEYIHSAVCHGAAMLGAKAASAVISTAGGGDRSEGTTEGQGEDLWDIMDRMSKPGKKIDPSTDEKEIALFGVKYEVFLEQCFNQRRYRGLIDDVVEGWK